MLLPTVLAGALVIRFHIRNKQQKERFEEALTIAQNELRKLGDERRAERAGRIRAERALRQLSLEMQALRDTTSSGAGPGTGPPPPANPAAVAYPFRAIGTLRSCFDCRNGTPRQPLLVESARASLTLRPGLSPEFLQGLEQYTHCWVLYVFHRNTDLQRLWGGSDRGLRAKIRVPRLDGGRLGALATRSPHRPCPIGLSVARVLRVSGRTLLLGGADVVDGSPVLDIKPYVPFCDAVPGARAPAWVAREAGGVGRGEGGGGGLGEAGAATTGVDGEPLALAGVRFAEGARGALEAAWGRAGRRVPLCSGPAAFLALVCEALGRDIRSVTQRVRLPARRAAGGSQALDLTPVTPGGEAAGFWRVALDGVEVAYDVVQEGSEAGGRPVVIVQGGRAWTAAAGEGEEEAWADDVDRAPVAPE
ncbi:CGL87 [Auxenochlorella protothecoides x Auxenochlorella symbiontica]